MKMIRKFLQAFLVLIGAGLTTQQGVAQCTVQTVVKHASCYSNNGSIQLQVTGTAPFHFEWANGQKTQNVSQLAAGKYKVTVTDAKGSRAVAEVEVLNIAGMEVSLSATSNSITTTVSGGTKPYRFVLNSIKNPSKIQTIQNSEGKFTSLAAGEYVVIVTDARRCSGVKNITIP